MGRCGVIHASRWATWTPEMNCACASMATRARLKSCEHAHTGRGCAVPIGRGSSETVPVWRDTRCGGATAETRTIGGSPVRSLMERNWSRFRHAAAISSAFLTMRCVMDKPLPVKWRPADGGFFSVVCARPFSRQSPRRQDCKKTQLVYTCSSSSPQKAGVDLPSRVTLMGQARLFLWWPIIAWPVLEKAFRSDWNQIGALLSFALTRDLSEKPFHTFRGCAQNTLHCVTP